MKGRVVVVIAVVVIVGAWGAGHAAGTGASVRVERAIGSAGGTATRNGARARAEAVRLLGLVELPAGTARSENAPAGSGRALSEPTYDEATPNLVDAHAWWTTSVPASAVLAYVARHLPPGAKRSTTGSSSGPPGTIDTVSETFALPPVAGVLTERVLGVSVAILRGGVSAVRTDGEAVWLTPRPSWERIPAGVSRVVFTASGQTDGNRLGPVSAPRVLTGSRAGRLVAFINRAEVVQPGASSCPAAFAEAVTLQFLTADGRSVARAIEDPTGCASVTLTVGRRTGPELSDDPSVTDELLRLGAVPTCAAGELTASVSLPGRNGPANARLIDFSFQNSSDVTCRLSGFPRLALFDAAGRKLPIALTDQGASIVRREGVGATSVLDPDQSAGFGATYTVCRDAPVAVRAQVMIPGVESRFTLTAGNRRHPFAPCHHAVGVGNL
jgi:hypothetical protein